MNESGTPSKFPKLSRSMAIFWGVALFALRLWTFRYLGRILAYGWPQVAPPDMTGVSGYVKVGVGLFAMIFLTCTHTWSMLSEKRLNRFVWMFPICDLVPAIAGTLWGYFTL